MCPNVYYKETMPHGRSATLSPGRQALGLLICLALPFGVAAAGGWITTRSLSPWYEQLVKPDWTPPGSVIGTIWSVLYASMGISAWLGWRAIARGQVEARPARMVVGFFALQLALNFLWSWAFFGLRSPAAGLAVIVPLWLAVLGWSRAAGQLVPLAGWLQYPYLAWVAFAAILNAAIWDANRS